MNLLATLKDLQARYDEIASALQSPDATKDMARYAQLNREYAEMGPVLAAYKKYSKMLADLKGCKDVLADPAADAEMRDMAKLEIDDLLAAIPAAEEDLKIKLLPKDAADDKNIIIEIRAGTGGDEAALFAGDIYRMYCRYAEQHRWKVEELSRSDTPLGGVKEVIAQIVGNGVYARLKFESGVHRVQRVPDTETQGRIHTSAITVAVLPEAEEVDVHIEAKDLRIDVFRSSGPGGQSVNTTDSAVRVTHIPTGLVVQCQDEKSQHKNKEKALKVLRARLLDKQQEELDKERSDARKSQIGSGDRSERIRTYNFPQSRVTDHRINFTSHALEQILAGEKLDELIDALVTEDQAKRLASLEKKAG
jgi:peptide chain release factor 1